MYKKILNSEALQSVSKSAIKLVSSNVKVTLGPHGRPVIIQKEGRNPDGSPIDPIITKDGVTVAENTSFRDPSLNTVAQTIIQVAKKTVSQGGDGTTTSIVLAEAIYNEGLKHTEKGTNNIELYRELNAIKDQIISYVNDIKIPIDSDEDIRNVALISSNGDEEVSDVVVQAIKAAGEHGYIELEDGSSKETTLNVIDGASYKSGWRKFAANGSLLVNDKSRNVCEFENSAVLLYAGKLDDVHELHDFLNTFWGWDDQRQMLTDVSNPVVLVAYDFSDDVKNFILQQRTQGKLPIAAIKAPRDGSPNHATEMLHDMGALLGATVTAKGIIDLKDATVDHLGGAEKITIGAEETVFYGGGGSKEDVKNRLSELETLLDTGSLDPWDAQNVRIRKGKLSQGIVIVRVGGNTEVEIQEKKDRAEDALCAARVAVKDGIVPGGGLTLYELSKQIEGDSPAARIMREALKAPIKQIIANSGKSADAVLTKLECSYNISDNPVGYDVRAEKYVNMLEAGIIDPAQVTKSALENAVSIAGLLLTTGGALVSDQKSEDGESNPLAGLLG